MRKLLRWGARAATGAVIAVVVTVAFRGVDPARAVAVARSVGWAAPLVVAPALLALLLDACAWRTLLRRLGRHVPLAAILRARIAAEAVALTVPGGPLAAESIKPKLLQASGVPLPDGVAVVAARKVVVLATNAAYVAIAVMLGFRHGSRIVVAALAAVALVLALLSASVWIGGRKLRSASAIGALLARLPKVRVAQSQFHATDTRIRLLFDSMSSTGPAIFAPVLGAWLLEAIESFLVLRLVGVRLPFGAVLVMEVAVSVLRNLTAAVPAGLGVQDAGWAAWLATAGIADPTNAAAAFALLKRAKDAAIALAGYGLLVSRSRANEARPSLRGLMPGPRASDRSAAPPAR